MSKQIVLASSSAIALGLTLHIFFPLAAYSHNFHASKQSTIVDNRISQSSQSTKLTIDRLGIGGVKIGALDPQIRRVLGKPQSVKEVYSPGNDAKVRSLKYSQINIDLVEESAPEKKGSFSVFNITTTSRKFPTLGGVRVGDRLAKVTKTYGKPSRESKKGNVTYVSYDAEIKNFSNSGFVFKIEKDKVTEITCVLNLV
jgi:hypothetical protein